MSSGGKTEAIARSTAAATRNDRMSRSAGET
jgi:hypothetical protein